jgi:hypothetical protein
VTGITIDEFRAMALALPGTVEGVHQGHPDFRVRGKVFATLGYPDDAHGMVKLTTADQAKRVRQSPGVFSAAKGEWGKQGSTLVGLPTATEAIVRPAIHAAWQRLVMAESGDTQSAVQPRGPNRKRYV